MKKGFFDGERGVRPFGFVDLAGQRLDKPARPHAGILPNPHIAACQPDACGAGYGGAKIRAAICVGLPGFIGMRIVWSQWQYHGRSPGVVNYSCGIGEMVFLFQAMNLMEDGGSQRTSFEWAA